METLREEQQSVDRLSNSSFPVEITDEILSRLPVKSVLRSRSVSKQWLSRISDPSLTKLYFTRATARHRTAVFISAYDQSTRKQHFLSAARDGGPLTHLITLDDSYETDVTEVQHLNGLVCFTCLTRVSGCNKAHAFVLNPSTRKAFKLPDPTNSHECVHMGYLFGFDESANERKIVLIRKNLKSDTIEFMIFSLPNYSWRKIDVEPPIRDRLTCDMDGGVCVNSIVHVMLQDLSYDILAFDLKTDKLSIISIPQAVVPREVIMMYSRNDVGFMKENKPRIMKVNGCVGVVCHDRVAESKEIDVWMLQDYENRVWVRETIKFPEPWVELGGPFPLPEDDDNMEDEIVFSSSKVSVNVMMVPVYNKKSGCFKLLEFTLGHEFLCSKSMKFNNIKCYVESILPL